MGPDPWLGKGDVYLLSNDLTQGLSNVGLHSLRDYALQIVSTIGRDRWILTEIMGLNGVLKVKWNLFVSILIHNGIVLNQEKDSLAWLWGIAKGKPSTEMAYDAPIYSQNLGTKKWWNGVIWKSRSPLKIKQFTWLLIHNKVLTWDNCMKRGMIGPGRCILFGKEEESVR